MLKFDPILKTVVWGGEKIAAYKGLATDLHGIGESWELSGLEGHCSVVAEGPDRGMSLSDLLARDGARLLGARNYARFGNEFPLLVKFIDARADLSVQVHPNDALARRLHGAPNGKTEMWYVVSADADARLKVGFREAVSPAAYEAAVADGTIADLLAEYRVQAGDLFYLPAGRIHSIGAGCFLVEIQQSSDITYRVWDYNRLDTNGCLRELHTEAAKAAIDFAVQSDYRSTYETAKERPVPLIACEYFTTHLFDLTTACRLDLASTDSFVVAVCIEGAGTLTDDCGECLPIRCGETVLIPASARSLILTPAPTLKLITARIE